MTRLLRSTYLTAATISFAVAWHIPAHSADVVYGKRIAERYCASCHATGGGQSPNPDAPPCRDFHKRYRVGGLDTLLSEGMLAPSTSPEEGSQPPHPRMPQAVLGDDEIAALKAYLHSLEPVPDGHAPPATQRPPGLVKRR